MCHRREMCRCHCWQFVIPSTVWLYRWWKTLSLLRYVCRDVEHSDPQRRTDSTQAWLTFHLLWWLLSLKALLALAMRPLCLAFYWTKPINLDIWELFYTVYRIAGNFSGGFNCRIGEFFSKSPKLILPNTRGHARERNAHNCIHNSEQWVRVRHTRIRQIKIRQ